MRRLALSDPEDILNSGIDITVQPPGKIVKTFGITVRRRKGPGCDFSCILLS